MLKFTPYFRIGSRVCHILPALLLMNGNSANQVEICWAYLSVGISISHVPAKNSI